MCKLLITLESGGERSGGGEVEAYVRWAGPSLVDALHRRHHALVRHVVDFFNELLDSPTTKEIIMAYPG